MFHAVEAEKCYEHKGQGDSYEIKKWPQPEFPCNPFSDIDDCGIIEYIRYLLSNIISNQ